MKISRTISLIVMLLLCAGAAQAGPYASGTGTNEGGTIDQGIRSTDPRIVGWVSDVVDYSLSHQLASVTPNSAAIIGPYKGAFFILGDMDRDHIDAYLEDPVNNRGPGYVTVTFEFPIMNGEGPDFAVFENAFGSGGGVFAELAYVEVSTNGIDFARFPSISLTTGLVGGYGTIDGSNVYNLAGKHISGYGTPFNLNDLEGHELVLSGVVKLDEVWFVRIVDIPGSGDFKDSLGNPIYDAWLTFGTGGFDFTGLGVLHFNYDWNVPEPATMSLLTLGALALVRRNRR